MSLRDHAFGTFLLVLCTFFATTQTQSLSNPGENQFNVVFEFEDVAPDCCPMPLPSCGDGHCNRTETCDTCPQDCLCALCGDYVCDSRHGEDCTTCPRDCGECPRETCGDNVCDSPMNENCKGCPQDCGECVVCGDGTCEFTEDCDTCQQDCGFCDIGYLEGVVLDLFTQRPIVNATVSTFGHKGTFLWVKTNEQGRFYFLRLPPGAITLISSHPDYGGPQTSGATVVKDTMSDTTVYLAPKLQQDEWAAVLRWENVYDLDLTGFADYDDEVYNIGVVNWEHLDRNEAYPWGTLNEDIRWPAPLPEIMRFGNMSQNTQNVEIWVHNWTGDRRDKEAKFQNSEARVDLVREDLGIVRTLNLSRAEDDLTNIASRDMTWWHVYDVTPQSTFETVNVFHAGSSALCGFISGEKAYCPYFPRDIVLKAGDKRRK